MIDRGSKSRLNLRTIDRFPSNSLFDRIARAVCRAECLPRKELYESWEMARRVRRQFRGGRIVELTAGHALLSRIMLLLDDTSPNAIAIDTHIPASAPKLAQSIDSEWPRLAARVEMIEASIDALPMRLEPDDLLVAAHACGALTDRVIALAIEAQCRVAVLPCCHDATVSDTGALGGWLDAALAIDVTRAARLTRAGFTIRTLSIPAEISPKNRLLLGAPTSRE